MTLARIFRIKITIELQRVSKQKIHFYFTYHSTSKTKIDYFQVVFFFYGLLYLLQIIVQCIRLNEIYGRQS